MLAVYIAVLTKNGLQILDAPRFSDAQRSCRIAQVGENANLLNVPVVPMYIAVLLAASLAQIQSNGEAAYPPEFSGRILSTSLVSEA